MQTHLKPLQRKLRNNMPAPELRLWYHIRKSQLGVKFRRQYVMENYILDFYSPELRLCIELDGDSHYSTSVFSSLCNQGEVRWGKINERDRIRDKFLQNKKIKVLRFLNTDIKESLEGVIEMIKKEIKRKNYPPSNSPLVYKRGETD